MLGDLQTTAMLVMFNAQLACLILDIKPLLQHRSKVDWLSNRRNHLKSRLSDLLDFKASAILGYDSLWNSMAFRKWLKPSVDDIDKSLSSSSLHFWSALTDFFNLRLSFSRDFIVLEIDFIFLPTLRWQKISHRHHPLLLSCRR